MKKTQLFSIILLGLISLSSMGNSAGNGVLGEVFRTEAYIINRLNHLKVTDPDAEQIKDLNKKMHGLHLAAVAEQYIVDALYNIGDLDEELRAAYYELFTLDEELKSMDFYYYRTKLKKLAYAPKLILLQAMRLELLGTNRGHTNDSFARAFKLFIDHHGKIDLSSIGGSTKFLSRVMQENIQLLKNQMSRFEFPFIDPELYARGIGTFYLQHLLTQSLLNPYPHRLKEINSLMKTKLMLKNRNLWDIGYLLEGVNLSILEKRKLYYDFSRQIFKHPVLMNTLDYRELDYMFSKGLPYLSERTDVGDFLDDLALAINQSVDDFYRSEPDYINERYYKLPSMVVSRTNQLIKPRFRAKTTWNCVRLLSNLVKEVKSSI